MHKLHRVLAVTVGLVVAAAVFTFVVVTPWQPHGGGVTQAAENTANPELRRSGPLRVMPLGDSITEGNGWQVPGAYRPHLWQLFQQANVPVDFVGSQTSGPASLPDKNHEGHPGWTIEQLDEQIASWVRTYRPDVILLHAGTNNIWRPNELPTTAPRRLSKLIDHITQAAPNAHVYVASIVPSDEHDAKVRQFNQTIQPMVDDKANRGAKVSFVDQYEALTGSDSIDGKHPTLIDGIHPTAEGYAMMAERWWEALSLRE